MSRGQRNYTTLFPIETPVVLQPPERKGRSEMLVLRRNEFLISRYYYYKKVVNLPYQSTIDKIVVETFLTERTVQDILQKNQDLLKHIISSKPEVHVFRKKFPHIMW